MNNLRQLLLMLCLLIPVQSYGESVFITDIIDGDSLRGRLQGQRVKTELRLWGIDSPEWNQPFGKEARNYLKVLVLRKELQVIDKGRDRYNRLLVILYDESASPERSINEELVANGFSWVYKRFCNEWFCDNWLKAQELARKKKSGLWVSSKPVPPWQSRRNLTNN